MREKNGEQHQRSCSKTGRFVTLKPKTPTVAAQFHDSLANLLDAMSKYVNSHTHTHTFLK